MMKNNKLYNESATIWKQWEHQKQMDMYIEQVLFNTDDLYLEEGVLDNMTSMLKKAGTKVKDAFQKYNPQELYNRAYSNISNKKAELSEMHPNASKLFKIAANPRNIKLAMMAIALLGALGGVDTSSATDMLNDLPEDDQNLAAELMKNHEIAQNVRDGEDAIDGTLYDTEQLAKNDIDINYQGIDDHIDQLVASGALDQQAADNILMCMEMKSGLELGSFFEGVNISSYDKLINETNTITDDSGVTMTGEETFESYIKTTITDKNGETIKLAEIKTTMTTEQATGNVSIQKEHGGLDFDIISMMDANIKQLPPEQQEERWKMINARETSGLGIDGDMTAGPGQGQFDIPKKFGGYGKPEYQVHDTARDTGFDVSKQFASNPPLGESKRDNDLIWESYLTESSKQQTVANVKQLEAQYLKGLRNLAEVMVQRAIRKQVTVGQTVPAKQL